MFKTIRVRTNILLTITAVVGILALAMLSIQYFLGKDLAQKATQLAFSQMAEKIQASIHHRDEMAKERIRLLEYYPEIDKAQGAGSELSIARVRNFAYVMANDERIYAIYTGYPNGDLFEVVNLPHDSDLYHSLALPNTARWMVIRAFDTPHHGRLKVMDFLDSEFNILVTRDEPTNYDSRQRPWFTQTQGRLDTVRGQPYMFSSIQQRGITFSKSMSTELGQGVIAMDYTLQEMSDLLRSQAFFDTGEIYIFTPTGDFVASSGHDSVADEKLVDLINNGKINQIVKYESNGVSRYGLVMALGSDLDEGSFVGFSVSVKEMLDPYMDIITYSLLIAILILLIMYPVVRYATGLIVHPIKDLINENEKIKARKYNEVGLVKTNIVEFIDLSQSQIALSKSILDYEEAQKELLKSFVRLIADAIDEKSPYTGGHCKRVPEIAMMLAKAADEKNDGVLSSFHFESQEDWDAFEMGAWLHDCGKITTPEFVVDKSTKLEALYNRIHEIRMRFEVIWRDIDVQYFTRLHQGEETPSELKGWRFNEQNDLLRDFEFIATCNIGGEYMSDADIERIRTIAQRTWVRHFDDRLGISGWELSRFKNSQPKPLPVTEYLISDKPEHRIERTDFDYQAYVSNGFKLDVPVLLYNYGEIYNLTLKKGTLTPEDRFKINEHVIMSIKLLEQLPFPGTMKRIPEYAGTHHEAMDGSGYPRGLARSELSIPSRIMAIADIFEALTASDRPYKRGKTLSEALGIMHHMVLDEHIDADLFALFLSSGVYIEYAQKHLRPEQLDLIDIDALLPPNFEISSS